VIDLRLLAVEETRTAAPADRAAALRRCCGHTSGTAELADRGFRFYPMPGGDLPHFFCKRLDLGGGRLASLTVLAGIDTVTGEPVLEGCRTTADAREALASGPPGTWLVRLMVGNATVAWPELTSRLVRGDAEAFAALSDELLELPLHARRTCPICKAVR
jgi:hypothetical protein